jgi:undecaprenyl pyrophosphate phosphatase UppP
MKIDIMNVLYTTTMIILAFVTALVVTKTISKYIEKKKGSSKDDE